MPEEVVNTETVEEVGTKEVETPETTKETEEMIPKSQMEKIIKDRVAREKKATEKAVEEAKRLGKMNEDEKQQYEFEQLRKELDEYKKKDTHYGLAKEASKMLSEHDIQADDELLQFVVKDDAEATKSAVDSFVSMFNKKVEQSVKKALSGTAPKVHTNKASTMTKEEFTKLSYPEKLEFKRTNEEQYKQLSAY